MSCAWAEQLLWFLDVQLSFWIWQIRFQVCCLDESWSRSGRSRNLTGVYWALYANYALKRVMHFSYWVILLLLFFVLVQWKMVTVPSPQCVGREFVRQYYTLLNQEPVQIHRWGSQPLSSLKIILLITFWRLPFDSFFWCYQTEVPSLPNEDLCLCYLCNQIKSLFKVHIDQFAL